MAAPAANCNVIPCRLDSEAFVFISYAHEDAAVVFPIIENVSANGYHIWYDKGINISSTWTDEIAIAILGCKAFVVFITAGAMSSPYVRSEVEFALNKQIKIIPVYLEGQEVLPPGLALGLSATQGVTNVSDPARIAADICAALAFNQIPKQGEIKNTNIHYKPYKAKKAGKRVKNTGGQTKKGGAASIVRTIMISLIIILLVSLAGAIVLIQLGVGTLLTGT